MTHLPFGVNVGVDGGIVSTKTNKQTNKSTTVVFSLLALNPSSLFSRHFVAQTKEMEECLGKERRRKAKVLRPKLL